MGVPRSPTLKEVKNPPRPPILFMARRRGALLIMPRPLSGCQIKSKTKGFLLRYRLFLYYQRFFQNIEKDWRKIFEKDYFRDFLKMMKFTKKTSLNLFNILKKPMLVQKQRIRQQKVLDLSFFLTPQKWAWHHQEGATPACSEKHILLNFMGAEGF